MLVAILFAIKIYRLKIGSLEISSYLCGVKPIIIKSIWKQQRKKRTREEVRAAFREYLDEKKKRMEEKQRELEEIHEMRMSGRVPTDGDRCCVLP